MTTNKKKTSSSSSKAHSGKGEKMTAKRRGNAPGITVDGKKKFPVDDAHSAKSAVHLLNNAKPPLTSGQRAAVMKNVHSYLPDAKAPAKQSSKKG